MMILPLLVLLLFVLVVEREKIFTTIDENRKNLTMRPGHSVIRHVSLVVMIVHAIQPRN